MSWLDIFGAVLIPVYIFTLFFGTIYGFVVGILGEIEYPPNDRTKIGEIRVRAVIIMLTIWLLMIPFSWLCDFFNRP